MVIYGMMRFRKMLYDLSFAEKLTTAKKTLPGRQKNVVCPKTRNKKKKRHDITKIL